MVGWAYNDGQHVDLKLVIFDKDGCLVDFEKTWMTGYREMVERVATEVGEPKLAKPLLKVVGWVEEEGKAPRVAQDGLLLHGTLSEISQIWIETQPLVAKHFGADGAFAITTIMEEVLKTSTVRDATPLGPVEETLRTLRGVGVKTAVVTNDQESLATAQLAKLGWTELFDTVVGADSGHGAKPDPHGVRSCIEAAGCHSRQAIMLGDSEGDVTAGKRADCLFTVAIAPDGKDIDAGLAAAAFRIPHVGELIPLLEAAGWCALKDAAKADEQLADAAAHLSLTEEEKVRRAAASGEMVTRAAADAAAVDPDIIALVGGMEMQARVSQHHEIRSQS